MENQYVFSWKTFHEVTVIAESREEAWDKFYQNEIDTEWHSEEEDLEMFQDNDY